MMENNLIPVRDIETVTQEIQLIKRQAENFMLQSAIEIGRRLQEAKALVPFGEWGNYLREKVEFSQSTANNMMRVAEEYGDEQISLFGVSAKSQAFGNLTYTKALRLLALPAEDREEFIEENDVENMSTRELEKALKERDEAKEQLLEAEEMAKRAEADADAATEEREKLRQELISAKEALDKAKVAEKKAKEKLKNLKENPEIPQDILDQVRLDAETAATQKAEAEKKEALADAVAAKEAAEKETEKAEQKLAEAIGKMAAMEKVVKAASPEVTVFKTWFERVQEDFNRMQGALLKVREADPETGERLQAAVKAMVDAWQKLED